jgi:hypothetical protein
MAGVHDGGRQVELVVGSQPIQQGLVDPVPHPGLVPGFQIPPATHAAAASHLLGKVFPGYAALQNKQDAPQGFATVQRLAARVPEPTGFGQRQKRFDHAPQLVIQ